MYLNKYQKKVNYKNMLFIQDKGLTYYFNCLSIKHSKLLIYAKTNQIFE